MDENEDDAPYRLVREARKEFKASRKDLELLLQETAEIDDPFLREIVGGSVHNNNLLGFAGLFAQTTKR